MAEEDEGFISRWSKRKTDIRSGKSEEDVQQTAALAPEIDTQFDADGNAITSVVSNEDSQPEMLEEADFEDVDFNELDKSSDYTRFIKANVPAAIQKRALRKLWASDSVFEVLDGMNDYDEDFTGNGLAGKIFKTAHKVGRGFITDEDDAPADDDTKEEVDEEISTELESEVNAEDSEKPDDDEFANLETAENTELDDETAVVENAKT